MSTALKEEGGSVATGSTVDLLPPKSDMDGDATRNGESEPFATPADDASAGVTMPQSTSPPEIGSLYKVANLLKDTWVDKEEVEPLPTDPYQYGESDIVNRNHYLAQHLTLGHTGLNRHTTKRDVMDDAHYHNSFNLGLHGGSTRLDCYPGNMQRAVGLRGMLQGSTLDSNLKCAPEQGVYTPVLPADKERSAMPTSGLYEADGESLFSATPEEISSVEDSDQENRGTTDGGYMNTAWNCERACKTETVEAGPGDSIEAKRARVENIISSMHTSPSKTECDERTSSPNSELRRPKRKQHTPQQHENHGAGEPYPKQRCLEKEVLRKQLSYMQEQLARMQYHCSQLFYQGETGQHNQKIGLHINSNGLTTKPSALFGLYTPKMPHKETFQQQQQSGELKNTGDFEMDSLKQLATPLRSNTPSDIKCLAKLLKEELTQSVNCLVDSIVSKFVTEQKTRYDFGDILTATENKNKEKIQNNNNNNNNVANSNNVNTFSNYHATSRESSWHSTPKTTRAKVTDKILRPLYDTQPKTIGDFARIHPHLFSLPPYYPATPIPTSVMHPMYGKEPEQTEALSLVVNTPKKKRTKVTDTRLSPRAARALLQDPLPQVSMALQQRLCEDASPPQDSGGYTVPGLIPMSLPTSVAIPNPSLQHSDVLAMYSHAEQALPYTGEGMQQIQSQGCSHSPSMPDLHGSASMAYTPDALRNTPMFKTDDLYDNNNLREGMVTADGYVLTSTLTPMHLRKAKLMFFYVRYPSSSILKVYFPDVKFNKNNTAQLVKWFSNFREFYYIQMEKYARQAYAEGVKRAEDIVVAADSEIYRVVNLHYNRNNQIEVPENFRLSMEATMREFFKSVAAGKDSEQSWKKTIYKLIARMDDTLPEYFKSPNWMEQLGEVA